MRKVFFSACLVLTGCNRLFPEPYSVGQERMAADLGRHFGQVYPASSGQAKVGLLAPRFGVPAIVRRGESFALQVLERGDRVPIRAALVAVDLPPAEVTACLAASTGGTDCVPLRLEEKRRAEMGPGLAIREYVAGPAGADKEAAKPPARAYDLVVSESGAEQRVRRSVFLTEEDPQAPRPIRVVQLSDLHLGKPGHQADNARNLQTVIDEVNALGPDLVVVTGDMAEEGKTLASEKEAADALVRLSAPVLTIPGNHDYGHLPRFLAPDEVDSGWFNFAREFHPFRLTHLSYAGWELVGYDSGPSTFSPRILTRGIRPETVDLIGGILDRADREGRSGVILFDHAPTRAVIGSNPDDSDDDGVGKMVHGGEELEGLFLKAAGRGQRVLSLSGHTHWSDVFEVVDDVFRRWAPARLACTLALRGTVAMINAPSSSEITFPTIDHGKRSGFVELRLSADSTRVRFHLRDKHGVSAVCRPDADLEEIHEDPGGVRGEAQ